MQLSESKSGRTVGGAVRGVSLACLFWLGALLLALTATAQETPREPVTLEAQHHDTHARLILTFTDRMSLPEYWVNNDNGVLVIAVEGVSMAGFLPDVALILEDYISIARFDPDMTSIRMGLRGSLQIHTIEAGEQLYIDLLPPNWVGLPPSLPPEVVTQLAQRAEDAARIAEERRRAEMVIEYDPKVDIRVGRHPTFVRVSFDWSVGTQGAFSREGDEAAISFDWPVGIDLYPIQSTQVEEIESAANHITPAGSVITLSLAEAAEARFYEESDTRFILDIDVPGAETGGIDPARLLAMLPEPEPQAGTEAYSSAPGGQPDPAPAQVSVTPYAMMAGSTVRVVFPFEEETAAAVFRRGDVVWMVFDTAVPILEPTDASRPMLDGLASRFSIEGTGRASVVRMELDQDRLATIGSEGRAWVLSLGDALLTATRPVALERRRTPSGLYEILADLGRPSQVHHLRDPDVGDILNIVTAYPPATSAVRDLAYVDFEVPRSAHGLVVKPLHDGVSVRIEDRFAVIAAETGLSVSPYQEIRFPVAEAVSSSALDLAPMVAANPVAFMARRDELLKRVTIAEGREIDRARLGLAQFYLANNLAHEALGILSILNADLRQASLEPGINATLAAASAVSGRFPEALALLNADPMRVEPDAMIWRAIARSESGDYAGARLDAIGAGAVIDRYPNWVAARFGLAAARAAIVERDARMAKGLLNDVELAVLDADQLSVFELLSGMLAQLEGRHADAFESYGRVIAADRRATSTEAVLRTIELLDKMGRLDTARAVDTLAVQATVWRGGPLELDIMRRLTDLQYREGAYRDAFTLTREATATFADGPVLDTLVDRARTEFAELFINGRADVLDPIDALAIYYDYRHLTPPGPEGDLMIRNLAQRLVRVDLLSQAADLLAYQVDNRLTGAARVQVAADLALIHIANRDPTAALAVLNDSRLEGLPPNLERQRRVLEASALIGARRQELALDMLSSLAGRDVELLRIEAYWSSGRYRQASELIEGLYNGDAATGSLSPVARMNVVKAGVGYVLANDQLGLARLRSRFSSVMAATPEWPLFAFVTEDPDITGTQFREIVRQVAENAGINAFLNAYREIYGGEGAVTPVRVAPDAAQTASL